MKGWNNRNSRKKQEKKKTKKKTEDVGKVEKKV